MQGFLLRGLLSERVGFLGKREGHVIITGFGLNGRNIARVLKEASIPYVVLEINSETVKEMKKKKGKPPERALPIINSNCTTTGTFIRYPGAN